MNVYVKEQWMPQGYGLSYSLEASIHRRVAEYQVSCTELTIGVGVNWRSQQPVQIYGVD